MATVTLSIGQTRNLTQQFLRLRSDARRAQLAGGLGERADPNADKATAKLLGAALGGSSSDGGASGSGSGDVELGPARIAAGRAPRWVTASEGIKGEMLVLRERMAKLREYHGKALLVSFGDTSAGPTAHVEALTHEVQLAFRRLDGEVRKLGAPEASAAGGGSGADDAAVRLQVQRQLAQALFKLSVDFRKEETRYLEKMEAQRGYDKGSSLGLVEEQAAAAAAASSGGGADPGFTQEQLAKASQATALIEERDEQIRKVVETITELAQIMRDLSTLVVEQGTMLDRIDHNISEAAVKIEEGTKEIVKAEKIQKSGRALYCIALLLCLCMVFLIATIVRHA